MSRTTVDLPGPVHEQIKQLAAQHGESVSYTIAGLVSKGLEAMNAPTDSSVYRSAVTGLPVLKLGLKRKLTADEALALASEDE